MHSTNKKSKEGRKIQDTKSVFAYVVAEGDTSGEVGKRRGKRLCVGRSAKCVGAFCREEAELSIEKMILWVGSTEKSYSITRGGYMQCTGLQELLRCWWAGEASAEGRKEGRGI